MRRSYDPLEPLIFMHIPKCGGVSVQAILKGWFGSRYVRPSYSGFASLENDFRIVGAPSCIHEHFNVYQNHLNRVWEREPRQLFTVLRDPFDMLVSLYNFGLQGERATLAKTCGSLDIFLDIMHSRRGTASFFTWLVERGSGESLARYAERFMLIGTTDNLGSSVNFLAQVLGRPTVEISVRNKSKVQTPVPDRREEFRKLLVDEYEFYDMAREAMKEGCPLGWAMGAMQAGA